MGRGRRNRVGAAVGSGIVARAAEQGGADFLLAINAGRLRSMGAPSIACMLPLHDASALTWEFAVSEILPITDLPVYVGVNCWGGPVDATAMATKILQAGFAGAVNFPTSMHFSEGMRRVLDQAGMGTQAEIDLLQAVQAAGGKSLFYCGTRNQARAGADAGLRALVYNFGWNLGGTLGHVPERSLEETALEAREISRFLKRHFEGLELLLEGGRILEASDLSFVARSAEFDGYVGGSTFDRVPMEEAVGNQIAAYRLAMDRSEPSQATDRRLKALAATAGLVGGTDSFVLALEDIRQAASGTGPVMLAVPPGGPVNAVLKLFDSCLPKHLRGRLIDLAAYAEDWRAFEEKLFGTSGTSGEEEFARPNTVLVLQLDKMRKTLLERLQSVFETGSYTHSDDNALKTLRARVLVISSRTVLTPAKTVTVRFPPLAERREDVPLLLDAAFELYGAKTIKSDALPAALQHRLQSYFWPRNEQELLEIARDILPALKTGHLSLDALDRRLEHSAVPIVPRDQAETPKQQVIDALARNNFRRGDTARALNISRKTLYNRMKKFGLL